MSDAPYWAKYGTRRPGRPKKGDYYEELALEIEAHADELGDADPLYYKLYGAADNTRHLGWIKRAEREAAA